jgi:hypothetical protein
MMSTVVTFGIPDWVADLVGIPKERIQAVDLSFRMDAFGEVDVSMIVPDGDPPDIRQFTVIKRPD